MTSLLYNNRESDQATFNNPAFEVVENKRSPLLTYSGIALAREVVGKLDIPGRIDHQLSLLKRHKPYSESDHILTMVYNLLTGGECLVDIERLQEQEALKRLLGTESLPDPTTAGDFLARFQDPDIEALQELMAETQQQAFKKLDKNKRRHATVDFDSSIHEVYGQKKEGADFSYNNTWSYHVLYGTLAETGDVLHQQLREGNRTSSWGIEQVLPGIFRRLKGCFQRVRFRADSGFYSKNIVAICEEQADEFFIVAFQTGALMNRVLDLPDSAWKSLYGRKLPSSKRGKKRRKRKNYKRAITLKRKPDSMFRGKTQVASLYYQPTPWPKPYRFVVTRTQIVDKENNQLYLADDLCRYMYHIIVTNTHYSDSRVIHIAAGRSNQENLIKDFKDGLGLGHVPTGRFLANKAYFLIAALAWNIKTWMLNLLNIGDAAKLRFKRFLYLWIYRASVVSPTGGNRIVLRIDPGEYFQRFHFAMRQLQTL